MLTTFRRGNNSDDRDFGTPYEYFCHRGYDPERIPATADEDYRNILERPAKWDENLPKEERLAVKPKVAKTRKSTEWKCSTAVKSHRWVRSWYEAPRGVFGCHGEKCLYGPPFWNVWLTSSVQWRHGICKIDNRSIAEGEAEEEMKITKLVHSKVDLFWPPVLFRLRERLLRSLI